MRLACRVVTNKACDSDLDVTVIRRATKAYSLHSLHVHSLDGVTVILGEQLTGFNLQ